MRKRLYVSLVLLFVPLSPLTTINGQQTPASKTASAGASASPASAAGLAGLSFAAGDWSNEEPTGHNQVMLCYKLVAAKSASQPFTLEPTVLNPSRRKKNPCFVVNEGHPLLQRQTLVLAIDARQAADISHIVILNLNLTTTPGTPLNLAPTRPSASTSSIPLLNAAKPAIYYFRWPIQLTGDSLPTLTVNAVYIAPVPGEAWRPDTLYPAGSVVRAVPDNGHFYATANEGRSGKTDPEFMKIATPATVIESPVGPPLTWSDLGTNTPPGQAPLFTVWAPLKQFAQGAIIYNPLNGHFYLASGGESGNTMPTFPVTTRGTVTEPPPGAITWKDVGTALPKGSTAVQWAPNTTFIVGQITAFNGHYYMATTTGQSGSAVPFPATPTAGRSVQDSPAAGPPLTWTDLGTGVPSGLSAPFATWSPTKQFMQGAVIFDSINGHFYVATLGGQSGTVMPTFPITVPSTVSEPLPSPITWEDVGTVAPGGVPATLSQWTPNTVFAIGQVISDPDNGHFYFARVGGQSGTTMPNFPVSVKPPISDGQIVWLDAGTTPPASVTSAGPTDQVLSLLNVQLPQVHSLYYYNIATGFAVNWNRNPTFVRVPSSPGSTSGTETYTTQKVKGSVTAEPILLFTTYLPGLPVDAESPWKPKDLIPGFSFGLSLSAPASSFYVGGSTEIWRNLQLAAGLNISKINTLAPVAEDPTSNAAPATTQRFRKAAFVGLTLNIDFIAGLFNQKL